METNSAANKVNVSATTQKHICDFIDCEPRGPIRIKDGREFEMYFARGIRPELLQGPIIDGVPARFRESYEAGFGHPPRAFPEFLLVPEAAAAV